MGSDPKFPAGGEALRRYASEVAFATIRESGRTVDDTDPLVRELVDVLAYYDLPLSSLVAWIRHQPGGTDLSTWLFTEHCQRLRNPHRSNGGGEYDSAGDPHVCPQCHASPVQRLGGASRVDDVGDDSPRRVDRLPLLRPNQAHI